MQKSTAVFVKSACATSFLSLAFLLGACAQSGKTATTAQKDEAIAIAVVGPMSGDLARFGEQIRRGAEKAVADINAKGGVLGRQLRLEIHDDQCNPPRAERIAKELVANGIAFVDGHFCSGSSIPASKIYGAAGVLQITPASTNPALTEEAAAAGYATVLRIAARDDRQGITAAHWLKRKYAWKSVAILDDGSAYGTEITAVIMHNLAGSSVRVAVRESFERDRTDFSALAAALKAKGVTAIYLGAYHKQIAAFVKALRASGSNAEVLAADVLNTDEFWQLAGAAANGVRYTDGWPGYARASETVVAAFRAEGVEPEGYTLHGYAAVQAFAAAATGTKGTSGPAMGAWLRANRVATVFGDIGWDAKGDIKDFGYAWYVWRGGKAVFDSDQ